ncbi:probable E3 SUMO-protein ligase RNF212 isoform X1 [Numida meleagris]|uniref:probable E3 SUMO-protein ligase RNF212 isoform X1 n=1 Tax=Numida meleagris TaxID=8996 RepID=UPI000B3DD357|nr:probable E3 SUMO-protein ligase RNF212 isoform X1 [Numida meleagris]
MAIRVFCNACFCEPRKATPRFIFTSCGHVICELCLQKGKKDECLICRTPCRTVFLSKETSPEIQSLFMGIDTLCKKYAKEITQISEFQEKNRKHLLAYHREKRVKLEESLRKARQQLHQIQCMKPPHQATQLPFASASRNPLSIPSRRLNGCSSYSLQPSHPSTSETMESMEVDPVPSPMRKPEAMTGPVRLSVITPPQDGRMGSVSYRSSQSSGITSSQSTAVSTRSTPVGLPHNGCSLISPSGSQSIRRGSWSASDFRTPPLYQFTFPSPQSSVTRHPITISGVLQRQHLGSANFGGQSAER